MPICTRCKQDLPESCFRSVNRKARRGREPHIERKAHCRQCLRIDGKEYRIRAHDKLSLSAQEYRRKHGPDITEKRRITKALHPDRQKEASRKHNLKVKLQVISHYTDGTMKCACCGENHIEFLTVDHINGGGRKHRKSITGTFNEWLKKNYFPDGYRILCYNCNCAMGHSGYCPHVREQGADKTKIAPSLVVA